MNIFVNVGFLVITFLFMCLYGFSFVLNLIRAIKVNKLLKANPLSLEGTVTKVLVMKKRTYVTVQYKSKANLQTFDSTFELTPNEAKDQYYEGQNTSIIFPEVKGNKRVHCFPVYLEGQKLSIEAGPMFMDIMIFAAGLFIFSFSLFLMLTNNAFSGNVPLFSTDATTPGVMSWLNIIVFLIIYLVLMTFILERIAGISQQHSENYLKICGLKAKAEVTTYKLTRNKNANGVRQSQIKIEFRTNKGEKVNTEIGSFMYTEQPDQFIDILYDGRRPQVAVYFRN